MVMKPHSEGKGSRRYTITRTRISSSVVLESPLIWLRLGCSFGSHPVRGADRRCRAPQWCRSSAGASESLLSAPGWVTTRGDVTPDSRRPLPCRVTAGSVGDFLSMDSQTDQRDFAPARLSTPSSVSARVVPRGRTPRRRYPAHLLLPYSAVARATFRPQAKRITAPAAGRASIPSGYWC